MALRISGSAGTGAKIIKNWNLFSFKINKKDGYVYKYDVKFDGKTGWMTIRVIDGKVEDATLDCGFTKILGIYNDPTLQEVAERIIANDVFKI